MDCGLSTRYAPVTTSWTASSCCSMASRSMRFSTPSDGRARPEPGPWGLLVRMTSIRWCRKRGLKFPYPTRDRIAMASHRGMMSVQRSVRLLHHGVPVHEDQFFLFRFDVRLGIGVKTAKRHIHFFNGAEGAKQMDDSVERFKFLATARRWEAFRIREVEAKRLLFAESLVVVRKLRVLRTRPRATNPHARTDARAHRPVEFSPFAYASEWTNRLEYLSSETTSNSRDFLVLRNEFPVHDHRKFIATAAATLGQLDSGSARPQNFGEFFCIFLC